MNPPNVPNPLTQATIVTGEAGELHCYWSDTRIRTTIPAGWYRYSIRGGDDGWEPATVERAVRVNHTADILIDHCIDDVIADNNDMLTITDWYLSD